jgi:hypothetical protein
MSSILIHRIIFIAVFLSNAVNGLQNLGFKKIQFRQYQQINFNDDAVECTSESGQFASKENLHFSKENLYFTPAITLDQNFEDESVECLSEGGKTVWDAKTTNANQQFFYPPSSSQTWKELQENIIQSISILSSFLLLEADALNIVKITDKIDELRALYPDKGGITSYLLRSKRYHMLVEILQQNRSEYLEIVNFLIDRIPRRDLPNLQNVQIATPITTPTSTATPMNSISSSLRAVEGSEDDVQLVDDCTLPSMKYNESPLDQLLLSIFRKLVQQEIHYISPKPGIVGLLEEGRYYKLTEDGNQNNSINQHKFVKNVLAGLLTPYLPPFYRIFMAGILPISSSSSSSSVPYSDPKWLVNFADKIYQYLPTNLQEKLQQRYEYQQGQQPLFYAPYLTSFVTPIFLSFLVGPSYPNRRKDGQLGGMIVEKCKFLQVIFSTAIYNILIHYIVIINNIFH